MAETNMKIVGEGKTSDGGIMADKASPIFIHALWRTGSTYIWSNLRENKTLYCYIEPFHEKLLNTPSIVLEAVFFAGQTERMSHPPLDRHYFREYPFRKEGGVLFFEKSFSYDDFCLSEEIEHPSLKRYIENLIRYSAGRPVFQFCRSPLRARWLKRNFESVNCYILRSPRDQWESYLSFDDDYFRTVNLIAAGKNSSSLWFKPLHDTLYIPCFDDKCIGRELRLYSKALGRYTLAEQYFIFYYIWLVSLMSVIPVCDAIIDIDMISKDAAARKAVEDFFKKHSAAIDLSDCMIKKYPGFKLDAAAMETVERSVRSLVRRFFGAEFKKIAPFFDSLSSWVSREHRDMLAAFFAEKETARAEDFHLPAQGIIRTRDVLRTEIEAPKKRYGLKGLLGLFAGLASFIGKGALKKRITKKLYIKSEESVFLKRIVLIYAKYRLSRR